MNQKTPSRQQDFYKFGTLFFIANAGMIAGAAMAIRGESMGMRALGAFALGMSTASSALLSRRSSKPADPLVPFRLRLFSIGSVATSTSGEVTIDGTDWNGNPVVLEFNESSGRHLEEWITDDQNEGICEDCSSHGCPHQEWN